MHILYLEWTFLFSLHLNSFPSLNQGHNLRERIKKNPCAVERSLGVRLMGHDKDAHWVGDLSCNCVLSYLRDWWLCLEGQWMSLGEQGNRRLQCQTCSGHRSWRSRGPGGSCVKVPPVARTDISVKAASERSTPRRFPPFHKFQFFTLFYLILDHICISYVQIISYLKKRIGFGAYLISPTTYLKIFKHPP